MPVTSQVESCESRVESEEKRISREGAKKGFWGQYPSSFIFRGFASSREELFISMKRETECAERFPPYSPLKLTVCVNAGEAARN